MKRIAIIGSGGAGKSTFAMALGERLHLPVHHLDALYWKPGWVESDRSEWTALQDELCAGSEWILDGNYGSTMALRLRACDTVIFLDMNRFRCMFRVIKRYLMYRGRTRPDMTEGCQERVTVQFLQWIFHDPDRSKPRILERLSQVDSSTQVLIFSTPNEVNAFLKGVSG